MKTEGISGEFLEVNTVSNKGMSGNIWSDNAGNPIYILHQVIQ
jgi:hypothetical protein